jgi:predicted RNA-binding protein with PIN domain
MARPFLIVDGYNLLHAAGMARQRYGPGQLERCRSRLIAWLGNHLTSRERERTTVVFDAAGAPPDLSPQPKRHKGLVVCFAPPGCDADAAIETMIAEHSSPRQVRLVSSDHRLQKFVSRRRGSFVDSEAFVDEIERRGPLVADDGPQAVAEPEGRGTPGTDTASWLRIFGEIPEASEFAAELDSQAAALDQSEVARLEAEIEGQVDVPRARPKKSTPRRP